MVGAAVAKLAGAVKRISSGLMVGGSKLMVCNSKLSQYCVGWDVEGVRGSKRAESGASTKIGEGEWSVHSRPSLWDSSSSVLSLPSGSWGSVGSSKVVRGAGPGLLPHLWRPVPYWQSWSKKGCCDGTMHRRALLHFWWGSSQSEAWCRTSRQKKHRGGAYPRNGGFSVGGAVDGI
jgi:hypothetical protein